MSATFSYTCADCGGTFDSERDDADANAEAEALWGVSNASTSPGMVIVCDDCFNEITEDMGVES